MHRPLCAGRVGRMEATKTRKSRTLPTGAACWLVKVPLEPQAWKSRGVCSTLSSQEEQRENSNISIVITIIINLFLANAAHI